MKTLNDYFQLTLTDSQAESFKETPKSIDVTFNLSHSGKIINGRVYLPGSHQKGLDSWLSPYPKPVLRNHDSGTDPIGRIKSVEYIDLTEDATTYLGNTKKVADIKDALEKQNPKDIRKAMKEANIINDEKWPGVGKILATARITDEDAIKKFLDQRYLTFSQSSFSDKAICTECGADWSTDGPCDHYHGKDEDGHSYFYMTGSHEASEVSVVSSPADKLGYLISIQTSDVEGEEPKTIETAILTLGCSVSECSDEENSLTKDQNIASSIQEEDQAQEKREDQEVKTDSPKVFIETFAEDLLKVISEKIFLSETKKDEDLKELKSNFDKLEEANDQIKFDYVMALKDLTAVKERVMTSINAHFKKMSVSTEASTFESLLDQFEMLTIKDEGIEIKAVEVPATLSISADSDNISKRQPTTFDEKIEVKYNSLLKEHGKLYADHFLERQRKYISLTTYRKLLK